jgi:putative FmdB family regulatory protein
VPLYEYRCTTCGKGLEVLQRLGEAPLATCPTCGGTLLKVLSAPALHFRGSGFYITDYARGGASGSPGPVSTATEATATPKKDIKPDAGNSTSSASSTSNANSTNKTTKSD